MTKVRVGNKQNSFLNGEWARHVRRGWKKLTSKIRRHYGKEEIRERLENE